MYFRRLLKGGKLELTDDPRGLSLLSNNNTVNINMSKNMNIEQLLHRPNTIPDYIIMLIHVTPKYEQ